MIRHLGYEVICDVCEIGSEATYGAKTKKIALEEAKRQGWRIYARKLPVRHICPCCKTIPIFQDGTGDGDV